MWIPVVIIIIYVLIIAIVISVAPGGIPPEAKRAVRMFFGLNCAHRGLYTKDQKVPENSLAAFAAAREKGYGVELDIQLTKDNEAIVFHDYDLKRTCGVDRQIADMTYEELSEYRLFGTDQKIPLLEEALEVLGDTPIIVEIKPAGPRNALVCQKTLEILQAHGHKNWCMESFDPRVCSWFKKNAPHILRGQLSCPPRAFYGISKATSVMLGNLLLNCLSRPHFIAYKNDRHPLIVKLCMMMKPIKAVWTLNPEQDLLKTEAENDIVIFEHYDPPAPRFKA